MTPRQGKLLLAALFPPKEADKPKAKPTPPSREDALVERFGGIVLPEK